MQTEDNNTKFSGRYSQTIGTSDKKMGRKNRKWQNSEKKEK